MACEQQHQSRGYAVRPACFHGHRPQCPIAQLREMQRKQNPLRTLRSPRSTITTILPLARPADFDYIPVQLAKRKDDMTSKKLYLLALAAMASFLVAGCGEGQQKSETAPGKDQANRPVAQQKYEPAYGDMIIRGSIGDASVLLPVLANDSASFDIIGLIYNGLVKYDKDLKLVPDLAEKWEISEDKLTIRFYLRKDVKWQDGKPFTSNDVELTYNVIVDQEDTDRLCH